MTPRDFCFWLAGILKMSKDDSPTDKLIREQLDEVINRQRANEAPYAVNAPSYWGGMAIPCSPEGTAPKVYPATLDDQLKTPFKKQPEHGWAYCSNPTGDTISDR